jgi:hypothetical protein
MDKLWPDTEYDSWQSQPLNHDVTDIDYSTILSVIYFAGISILFLKLLLSIIRVMRIRKHAHIFAFGELRIAKTNSLIPFSFFNTIFLPKHENNTMIVEHEKAHIKQFHWIDLVIAEIVSVVLWFNPFVVLYKRALRLQHEYLADTSVIKTGNRIENYLACMLKHVQTISSAALTSQFYCKTIKKRIIMITRNKTSVTYVGIYVLILPLVCLLLLAFTNSNYKTSMIATNVNAIAPHTYIPFIFSSDLNKITVIAQDPYTPSIFPVDKSKVTAVNGYGERIHPKYKVKMFHGAIDFATPEGEKILAAASGVVEKTDYNKKMGHYIKIKHSDIFSTVYTHLKSVAVTKGAKLERGQLIGYVGDSGVSTGPHLHYEVIKNGKHVNPADYLPK